MIRILIVCFLGSVLTCCSSSSPEQSSGEPGAATSQHEAPRGLSALEDSPRTTDSLVARGIPNARLAANFSFPEQFPMLNGILGNHPSLLDSLEAYARNLTAEGAPASDPGVEKLLKLRESLMQTMNPILETWDQYNANPDDLQNLEKELSRLGMRIAAAEGMFVKLAVTDLPPAVMQACSPPLRAHLNFIHAAAATLGGEYPYSNMQPYGEALAAGEKLMGSFAKSTYASQDDSLFFAVLDQFTGIYLRREGDYEMPAVGYPGDGLHEFALSEMESHREYVKQYPESRYTPVIKAVLETPSRSAPRPEELYIVYDAYFEDYNEAWRYKHQQIGLGNDMVHLIPVTLGNGKKNYLVAYRFFDQSEEASTYFEEKEKSRPDVKMMFTSWHNGGYVQSGI